MFMIELRCGKQKQLLSAIASPTLLFLPHTMVVPRSNSYEAQIVRAGTTYVEALCNFLRSPQIVSAQAPPGFNAAPGSQFGLLNLWTKYLARV